MPEGVQAEIDLPDSTPVRGAGGGHTFSGQLRLQ